jgi:DNA-binding PucR family transcriptional regulator
MADRPIALGVHGLECQRRRRPQQDAHYANAQILSEVPNIEGVERLARQWLGSLLDYDAQHGSELVATVSAYLECGAVTD